MDAGHFVAPYETTKILFNITMKYRKYFDSIIYPIPIWVGRRNNDIFRSVLKEVINTHTFR